jgi:hypothetical protein
METVAWRIIFICRCQIYLVFIPYLNEPVPIINYPDADEEVTGSEDLLITKHKGGKILQYMAIGNHN